MEELMIVQSEMLKQEAIMASSDVYAIKCFKLGLDFRTEYPDKYAAYTAARERYNELELEEARIINLTSTANDEIEEHEE